MAALPGIDDLTEQQFLKRAAETLTPAAQRIRQKIRGLPLVSLSSFSHARDASPAETK